MCRFCCIAVLIVSSVTAFADSIPTFNMTQGSVSLTSIDVNNFSIGWSFSNGSGLNLSGVDSWGTCLDFAPGGTSCNPNVMIGLNQGAATLNGSTTGIFGIVSITGGNFSLPVTGTTFAISMPVLFSGTFITCPLVTPPNNGCNATNTNAQFNINGSGSATLDFFGFDTGNGIVWQFSSANYNMNAVPEPASLVLAGTGVLAILSRLRPHRS